MMVRRVFLGVMISVLVGLTSVAQSSRDRMLPVDWHTAQWIGGGPGAIPFDSRYLPVFQLSFNLSLSEDCNGVGIIYGANDMRLMDRRLNPFGIDNECDSSYVEIYFSSDSVMIYRRGYDAGEIGKKLLKSFHLPPGLSIVDGRDIKVRSCAGFTTVTVDGVEVAHMNVSPTPGGGDYLAFPVVGDIGYSVNGGSATISDFRVENYRSPHNQLANYTFGKVSGQQIVKLPATGAIVLRRKFNVEKAIESAILYATARGIYDVYVNHALVDANSYLNPGASQYNRSHYFQTYDVTPMLHPGPNFIGTVLGEGWWSGATSFDPANWNWFGDRQSFLGVLSIRYTDGTGEIIITEPEGWEYSTDGPLRYCSLFQGEIYDATRPLFDGGEWHPAAVVELDGSISDKQNGGWPLADNYDEFSLYHDNTSGVRVFDTLSAINVRECSPGEYVYDMGVNHAGVPAITFRKLEKGQTIIIRYAEVLYPEHEDYVENVGKPMFENLRAAMSQDIYIASGAGVETYQPRTTYHGYRYIVLTGVDTPVPPQDVRSKILSSVRDFTSTFECSDTLINRLVENIRNSTLSNVFSIPTDCPQRNERMGWSGDISVFAPALSYLTDARDFLRRHSRALRDTREADGAYSSIAPLGGGFGGPLWQSVGIIVPWRLYLQYADTLSLKENYPYMKDYMSMVLEKYIDSDDGHFRGTGTWIDLGDWLGPQCNQNEEPLLFDSYLVYELDIMSRVARVLGYDDDSEWFADERARRVRFINDTYFSSGQGLIVARGFGSQNIGWAGPEGGQPDGQKIMAHTSYAVPLALGVVDDSNLDGLKNRLVGLVRSTSVGDVGREYPPYSLMTGFIGTPWILYALSDNGYASEAYSILLNRHYPSWLYPVTLGATSVWERLNSMTAEDGFGRNNGMNSFNHYAFGCVYDWLIQRVAGIYPDVESPGFRHFFISPVIDPEGRLTYASATYDSLHGRIESRWRYDRADGTMHYDMVIPRGTTATVTLAPGEAPFELGAGTYHFEIKKSKL